MPAPIATKAVAKPAPVAAKTAAPAAKAVTPVAKTAAPAAKVAAPVAKTAVPAAKAAPPPPPAKAAPVSVSKPAVPAAKAAAPAAKPVSAAHVASDPGLEARVAELEAALEIQSGIVTTLANRSAVQFAGYSGHDESWDLSKPEGPEFLPDSASIDALRTFVWQYSDNVDHTGDEKALRKAAKALTAKELALSERAGVSPTPPDGDLEVEEIEEEPEQEEEEASPEAEEGMSVEEVDSAAQAVVEMECAKYEIDPASFAKRPKALRTALKAAIQARLDAQNAPPEEEEEATTEAPDYAVGEIVLVYPVTGDDEGNAVPNTSEEAVSATITALGEDGSVTLKFGPGEAEAATEAFALLEGALKTTKKGMIISLPSTEWITRPAE